MKYIFRNAQVFEAGRFKRKDVAVADGLIVSISDHAAPDVGAVTFDFQNHILIPGLVDVHVHLREPGFSYKETIETGTAAAARGGFTTLCAMPNVDPVPDSVPHLLQVLQAYAGRAKVHVHQYGAITVGERGEALADLAGMAGQVVAFSDDGKGVQREAMMRRAMEQAKALGKLIAAHCEDMSLVQGGYIHDGAYARAHGHRGIPSESEWRQVERDIALAKATGCAYHVCHVSTKESVNLIRQAKYQGVNVSCETAPHYLTLCEDDLMEDGRFKMNPPLRTAADRDALVEGLMDGTIDMIATDHAPHAASEKDKGLIGSAMGIVGLETAFPVLYTKLVKTSILPLEALVECMTTVPRVRFGVGTPLAEGQPADLAVFDLNEEYTIDPDTFASRGRATPFAGWKVQGRCKMTLVNGEIVWQES